jgi:hypothetical protein
MEIIDCCPKPSCLLESMRNVGYSIETAIADIIDNSIAANSSTVSILHECEHGTPTIAIIDNGTGMSREELIEAMRAGGVKGPKEVRNPSDMGRFGLGLKTASFSQCRKLTVVSRKKNKVSASCWDLDTIKDDWSLRLLNELESQEIKWIDELPSPSGAMVLWEKMDRISERENTHVLDSFLEQIELVRKHLSLVFHRYLDGDKNNGKIEIKINNISVSPLDPFLQKYSATQKLETEIIEFRGEKIFIKPFIIPHYSKLKAEDRDQLKLQGGSARTQGFYVYRNRRLLAWGNWFRLQNAKTEASGLARVMIDIPNTLDELWSLDVKKSKVFPPGGVRSELMRLVGRIVECSTRTYTSRGQRLSQSAYPVWNRHATNEEISYLINRDHPILKSFITEQMNSKCKEFQEVLKLIERTLPVEAITNDTFGGRVSAGQTEEKSENQKYKSLTDLLKRNGYSISQIKNIFSSSGIDS